MNCYYHNDREAVGMLRGIKGVAEFGFIPECEECASDDSAVGLLVEPIIKDEWPDIIGEMDEPR